ncbi:MAG: bacteriohemerythrin [Candidatus Micrarchaeota archaeon]|nr:bacteriohemerythrin [Candidatus Micrarchaeota archaeon]
MALFEWTENLSVGIPTIDEQHKKLISIINELNEAMKSGKGKELIGKVIKELLDYTKYHFSKEEALMVQANYVGIESHKLAHNQFVKNIENSEKDFKNGKITVTIELINFLKDWLIKHIMGIDKKYSSTLIEKGIR